MPAIDLRFSQVKMATIAPKIEPTWKLKRVIDHSQLPPSQDYSLHNPQKKRRREGRVMRQDSTSHQSGASKHDLQSAQPPSSDDNDDLTNLNWLQDANLLKKFYSNTLDGCKNGKAEGQTADGDRDLTSSETVQSSPRSEPHHPKPPYSYSALIFMAIESSLEKCMMVRDIYCWIINNFPYFATAPNGWKNTIRHTLSLRKCFKKMEKPSITGSTCETNSDCDSDKDLSDIKGGYWFVDDNYRSMLLQQVIRAQLALFPSFLLTNGGTSRLHSELCQRLSSIPVNGQTLVNIVSPKLASSIKSISQKKLYHCRPIGKFNQVPVISTFSRSVSRRMNSNDSSVSHAPATQSCSTHPNPMHMQFKVQNRALSNKVSSGKTKTVGILAEQSSGNSVSVINVNQTPKVYAPVPTVIPHKSNSVYHKSPRFTSSSQIKSSDNNLYLNVHFLRGKKHQNNRSDVLSNFQCKPDAQYSKQRKAKCLKRTNPSQKCNENKSAQYTSNQGVIMKCNTSSNKTVKSKTSKCSKKISSFNALGNSADSGGGGGGEDKHLNDDEDELIRDGAQALLNFATGGFSLDRLMPHQD